RPGGEAGAAGRLDPGQREAGARRAADRFDRRRGQGAQALQPGLLVQPPGGEQAAVPQRVQVAALAAVVDLVVVAAAVVAVAGVQRLVRVAGQVHDELQRLQALRVAAATVGEDARLRLERL